LAAILFVVIDFSLLNSLLALPIVIAILFISTWIGHFVKVITTHHDLDNIPQEYTEKVKCGFWVAEAFGQPPATNSETKIEIIREEDNFQPLMTSSPKIIGTIAITIKKDPDLREPPNSVAWLRRMAVAKSFQRLGIGSVLTDVALEHCSAANFRAVELLTTEHHQAARSLYAIKGFDLIETIRKPYLGGLLFLVLYRLRIPCILTRSHLNA
jgi:GNAT superfamily N-acetyltransferase